MESAKLNHVLEPWAMDVAKGIMAASSKRVLDSEHLASLSAISMAQSAKRQADALEAQAEHLAHGRHALKRIADMLEGANKPEEMTAEQADRPTRSEEYLLSILEARKREADALERIAQAAAKMAGLDPRPLPFMKPGQDQ